MNFGQWLLSRDQHVFNATLPFVPSSVALIFVGRLIFAGPSKEVFDSGY
jgi:hypothetical protein